MSVRFPVEQRELVTSLARVSLMRDGIRKVEQIGMLVLRCQ